MNFPIRVYYEDTDAGGVVYHANYLHFFERARTEFLRQAGFSQQALLAESLAFVVTKLEIAYKTAARLDDYLIVETSVVALKKASILFSQRLLRENVCLSEALVSVASVDLAKMKAVAMPEAVRQALQTI